MLDFRINTFCELGEAKCQLQPQPCNLAPSINSPPGYFVMLGHLLGSFAAQKKVQEKRKMCIKSNYSLRR
jgi:hypothetical protein